MSDPRADTRTLSHLVRSGGADRRWLGPSAAEPLELAFEDELTGLPNRRLLNRVLREEWPALLARCAPLSLVMIDLDGFKGINDRHGHPVGDHVLRVAAGLLRQSFRAADLVIRYGGDEFAVVLPSLDAAGAEALALHVRQQFDAHVFRRSDGERIAEPLSFSFGVASSKDDEGSGPDLLAQSDRRLYADKRQRASLRGSEPRRPVRSLAVLPLRNLSHDPEQEYLAEGMTEELIVALARVDALRVVSRSSVMRYQGKPMPLSVIAAELGVDALIEGSVLRVGTRVRISVQLVDALSDEHLWAQSLDRDCSEILQLQSDMAQRVAAYFRSEPAPAAPVEPVSATAVPVYEAYLKGRFHWNRLTVESIRRAIDCFSEALHLDPRHGPSLAGLADCYIGLQFLGGAATELAPLARSAAQQAVQCAPQLAGAHSTLANVHFFYDWDWASAEAAFARALALDPRAPGAHQGQGYLYSALQRHAEAIAALRRARDLDPLGLAVNVDLGWRYYFARQYPLALRQLRLTLELDPEFGNAHWCLGCALLELGQANEAIEHLQRAVALSPGSAQPASSLGYALARLGRIAQARELLVQIDQYSAGSAVSPWVRAVILGGLGDIDAAIDQLELAHAQRTPALVWLNTHPELDPLRGRPRFGALVDRLQLR